LCAFGILASSAPMRTSNGEYGAYRDDEDEGRVRGYGHSRLAAIADLAAEVFDDDETEFDHEAAAFDHARKLRAEA
jgi:hypothetical protein